MPEPSTIILIGSGLLGIAGFRVRRKRPGHFPAKGTWVTRWKHSRIRSRQEKGALPEDMREGS